MSNAITTQELAHMHELVGQLHDVNHVLDMLEQHLLAQETVETNLSNMALGAVRTVVHQIRRIALELEGLHGDVRRTPAVATP